METMVVMLFLPVYLLMRWLRKSIEVYQYLIQVLIEEISCHCKIVFKKNGHTFHGIPTLQAAFAHLKMWILEY